MAPCPEEKKIQKTQSKREIILVPHIPCTLYLTLHMLPELKLGRDRVCQRQNWAPQFTVTGRGFVFTWNLEGNLQGVLFGVNDSLYVRDCIWLPFYLACPSQLPHMAQDPPCYCKLWVDSKSETTVIGDNRRLLDGTRRFMLPYAVYFIFIPMRSGPFKDLLWSKLEDS